MNDFNKPHLSASSISTFLDCSLKYRFSKIDKFPFEQRSDAMEFGTAIHKVLADFYQSKILGNKLSCKEMHTLFESYWSKAAEDAEDIQYKKGLDYQSYILTGKELLTTYYNNLPEDDFQTLSIEDRFSLHLDELEVPVVGITDLVEMDQDETSILVTDWKTSGKAYSNADIDQSFQLTIYYMAIKRMYPDKEIILKFDTLIKTKVPKFEQYFSIRTEEDEQRAIKKICAVWEGIKKGIFIPNDQSWKCGAGCEFKSYCDKWFKGEIS